MKLRYGLHARFITGVSIALLVIIAVVVLILQRQQVMQREVVSLSRDSMHGLVFDRLTARGEAVSVQVADSLVNPLYYFDLDAIGVIVRSVLQQPDVSYVVVYDTEGLSLIHI